MLKKELKNAVIKCEEKNRLILRYQDEINCQVLDQFAEKGLTPKDLYIVQKHIPIVYPWNDGYQTYRNNYNRRWSYFPMGIIRCANTDDVRNSLLFVKEFSIKFSIRSGAHCVLPFSLSTGIIIDLSLMNEIKVVETKESRKNETDIKCNKYVILGPASRLGEVAQVISPYNLSLPIGSCINTATGGLSLGGGISPSLIRLGGLMSDHMISAEVVLANGDIVTASKTSHPDLFFGLQGAGGSNFGIVTRFTFCPCKFNGATAFEIIYPFKLLHQILTLWQNFAPFTDRRLNTEINLKSPKFEQFPIEFKGQYEGSQDKLIKLINPFLELANPKNIKIEHLDTFADAGHFWGGTIQSYYAWNSIFWNNKMCDEAIDIIAKFLIKAPGPLTGIELNAMKGAVSDIKPTETAFPYRNALFWFLIQGKTLEPADVPKQQEWCDSLYEAIKPFVLEVSSSNDTNKDIIPAYINAPQKNLQHNDKYLEAYYSINLPKLIKIKTKYDPENVFNFPQGIPPKISQNKKSKIKLFQ